MRQVTYEPPHQRRVHHPKVVVKLTQAQSLHDDALASETRVSVHLYTQDFIAGVAFADVLLQRCVRLRLGFRGVQSRTARLE
jgi:hypothetical protein